jgi:hypothetical protein
MESAENHEQQSPANQAAESSDVPSLSKNETIKLLNDSIDRLEATIKGLKENDSKQLPPSDSIDKLVTTTQKLADAVVSPPIVEPNPTPIVPDNPATEVVKSESAPLEAKTKTETKTTTPVKSKPPTIKELKQQRQQSAINKPKSKQKNAGLIVVGIIALVIAIAAIVWFWLQPEQFNFASSPPASEIITDNQTPKPKVVNPPVVNPETKIDNFKPKVVNPPAINPETKTGNSKPEVISPPVIKPETKINQPKPDEIVVKNPPVTSETNDSEADVPTNISIPPDLTSPGRAKNLKIVTIEPELTFTPEQTLVAALQGKIAELTNDDEADIVNFIKVDLPNSNLIVEVKDNWYSLNESRQNKFANQILQRSRKLNFSKLELKDSQGTLVARNPVIGEQIIIVQSNQKEVSSF